MNPAICTGCEAIYELRLGVFMGVEAKPYCSHRCASKHAKKEQS